MTIRLHDYNDPNVYNDPNGRSYTRFWDSPSSINNYRFCLQKNLLAFYSVEFSSCSKCCMKHLHLPIYFPLKHKLTNSSSSYSCHFVSKFETLHLITVQCMHQHLRCLLQRYLKFAHCVGILTVCYHSKCDYGSVR